jgi:Domain of unknown function (DUF4105)
MSQTPEQISLPSPERAWRRVLFSIAAALWLSMHLSASAAAAGTPATEPPGANLDVALYTFGPGEEIWERFGHNAIEIRDRSSGEAVLYNYGIFDFAQKNFFLNFVRGLMTYRIAADRTADELPVYIAEGRWIVEQKLDLTPAQRAKLADFLAWNARPEHAQYRYDYFRANCSTRVRDALDAAVGGAIKAQTIAPSRGFTYRMDADRLMRPDPLVMLAMDAGLGPYADQRLSYWDEAFVPMQLMQRLRDVDVTDASGSSRPLVSSETRIAAARLPEPPAFPPDWVWQALGIGVAGALAMLGLARLHSRAWARAILAACAGLSALVLGLGGVVLVALWTLTDHVSAWRNENILLFDPLCLLLLPCWLGAFRLRWQPSRFARRIAIAIALGAGLAFFIKVFPAFPQDNKLWIALLLPLHAVFALAIAARRPPAPDS